MTRRTMLERLDDVARLTGIPQLGERPPRHRRLRALATLALALAAGGFVLGAGRPLHNGWLGYALLMLGFGLAQMMPIFGPLKLGRGRETVDEFDRALRARAFLVAFAALAAVAVIGLFLTAGLSALGGWSADVLRQTMIDLAFLLATIYAAGPTCYASWAMPRDAD